MEPRIADIARRIQALREDSGVGVDEMAAAVGISPTEYEQMESGEQDLSFSAVYKCAEKLGVDIIDLLTGVGPHLTTGYSIVRAGDGLSMKRREGFEYQHLAYTFRDKLAEPFLVTAPYSDAEQDAPIVLSRHAGQEFDYVLTGRLRFAYDGQIEELGAGDALFYDSGRGHGMIATGGEACTFLAVVLKDRAAS